MEYKTNNLSNPNNEMLLENDGFVIPDFCDSSDSVIPITAPPFEPIKFDIFNIFVNMLNEIDKGEISSIKTALNLFKVAIIDNKFNIPGELLNSYNVPDALMKAMASENFQCILYDLFCVATAWTGAVLQDSDNFSHPDFISFLIRTTVIALSDPKLPKDKKIVGNASLAFLRNLLANSNNVRIMFIKERGIMLFSSLYLELVDYDIRQFILWSLINALQVQPTPPLELVKQIETPLLQSFFGYNIRGADALEIKLSLAYIKFGPEFIISFLKNVEFESASYNFIKISSKTQIALLELFSTLVTCPDQFASSLAADKIRWNDFIPKIPQLQDNKLTKKLIEMSSYLLSCRYEPIFDTLLIKTMITLLPISEYKIRCRIINFLHSLMKSDISNAIDAFVCHKTIPKIVDFLDSDLKSIFKFALEILLYIIQYALDGKYHKLIYRQFEEVEFEPIMDEVCGRDLSSDCAEIADLINIKYNELIDFCNQDNIEEESDNEDQYQPSQHPYQVTQAINKELMNELDESENEEEDEWVDIDDVPLSDDGSN